ncbi:MAG: thioredoxin family protein [Hyphomicrobium sp.]|jgi:thiol:disulfide interchange protein
MFNRIAILAAALLAIALSSTAFAAERTKFDQTAFADAKKAGKSIVVHVTAPWCPTCKAQKPIVDSLLTTPEYKDTVLLDVDFDTSLPTLRALNVRSQSTLIAYKGEAEKGRSTGATNADAIEALIKSAQ